MDHSQSIIADAAQKNASAGVSEPHMDAPPAIGINERRMHVRAYNYWVSLLDDRDFPSIEDLDPTQLSDFGPNSVLIDFTGGMEGAAIAFLGANLRNEGELPADISLVAEVPRNSLLWRLTEHYLEIIANRAPIGFEAEFQNKRSSVTLYRGILMPFSSDGSTIDFIYGVVNWKEVAEAEVSDDIRSAVESVMATQLPPPPPPQVWAEGTGVLDDNHNLMPMPMADSGFFDAPAYEPATTTLAADSSLYDYLAAARTCAEDAKTSDVRSRVALYRALGQAHDFAVVASDNPAAFVEILHDANLTVQDRAPMTPVVKLIFGVDYDKTRLAEYAAVLSHGQRLGLKRGEMTPFLESMKGGLKSIIKAERALKNGEHATPTAIDYFAKFRAAEAYAHVHLPDVDSEFVMLVARREPDGRYAIVTSQNAEEKDLKRFQ